MADEDDRATLTSVLRDLRSRRVWEPAVGHGSFVTLEIGGRRTNSLGMVVGEHHLWVYAGHWTIWRGGSLLAIADDPRPTMERAVASIDGQSIVEAVFEPLGPSLTIAFTGDVTLRVGPSSVPDMEGWMLFLPDGDVISSGPGDALERRSASG